MARAKNQLEMRFVSELETLHERGDALNSCALFEGNTQKLRDHLLCYQKVTAADVTRVARVYLTAPGIVLDVVPAAPQTASPSALTNRSTATTRHAAALDQVAVAPATPTRAAATNRVLAAPSMHFRLPPGFRCRLANGLRVVVMEQRQLPLISAVLAVGSGSSDDPPGQAGLAHLTARMLDQGTSTRSALQIAAAFDTLGARYESFADWDATYFSLSALQPHFDAALEVLTDVILHPSFAAPEWERQRRLRQAWFAQRRADPRILGPLLVGQLLFKPDAPYGHSPLGDETSLQHIGLNELRQFYTVHYHPHNAVLVIVGDVQTKALLARLNYLFKTWPTMPAVPRPSPPASTPPTAPVNGPVLYLVDRPGAMQSFIAIGQPGVALTDARQMPLALLAQVMGGGLGSRLNNELRDANGYTYGAQVASENTRSNGLWLVSSAVQATATAPALATILRDLGAVRGEAPVSSAELSKARWVTMQGFPPSMETAQELAGYVADQVIYACQTITTTLIWSGCAP